METMENILALSPEEMLLFLDGLWDDDLDDDSNPSSTTHELVVSSPAVQLEDKLISIENGADVTTEVVGDIKNADHADIDAILAKEMADLSVQEREYVVQDIHGIAAETSVPEDDDNDEFCQQRLRQLEDCLAQIEDKPAYNRALYLSPEYVRNDKFRLLFLRGELFNVPAAAQLIVSHFEEKQRLFGPDLLGRDILLVDLSDTDRQELEKGSVQVLPVRDRAGRVVMCLAVVGPQAEETAINRQRSGWYIGMSTMLNDEDTLKKGIVVVALNVGSHRISYDKFPFIFKENKTYKALPNKIVSCHYCFDDIVLYPFITILRFFLGSRARGRLRTHYSKQRADYILQLLTYGIPTHVLPMDEHDQPILEYHLEWIQRREAQEASLSSSSRVTVMIPRRFDVLFGRGATIAEHTGNLRAFHIVDMNRERYEKAGKFEKTRIADRVVHLIHIAYGRFLKKEQGGWVEVTRDEAREKISHCFRRLRNLDHRKKGKQNVSTSTTNSPTANKRDCQETDLPNLDTQEFSPYSADVTKRAKSSSSLPSSILP